MKKIIVVYYGNLSKGYFLTLKELNFKTLWFKADINRYLTLRRVKSLLPQLTYWAMEKISYKLFKAVKEFKPDILLILKGHTITWEILKKIKQTYNLVLVNWYPDHILHFYADSNLFNSIEYYDFYFVKDKYMIEEFKKAGLKNLFFLLPGYDNHIFKPLKLNPTELRFYQADIAIGGTLYEYRAKILRELKKKISSDIKLKIWGSAGQQKIKKKDILYNSLMFKHLKPENYSKMINATEINLNTHHFSEVYGLNQRIFDVGGCKKFLISDYRPSMEEYFNIKNEIVVYKTTEELVDKVKYFLKHKNLREKISKNLYIKMRNNFTLKHQFVKMFKIIEKCQKKIIKK